MNRKRKSTTFLARVEKAWKQYNEGKFITKSNEEFLKELEKW